MLNSTWKHWLALFRRPSSTSRQVASRSRPTLECLEDRTVPATLYVDSTPILNGGGNDSFTASGGSQVSVGGLTQNVDLFTTIGAAVAAANNGDVINVSDGTYTEFFGNLNKTFTLRGNQFGIDARTRAGAETVMNNSQGAFNVTASNVVIDGFTFQDTTNTAFLGFAVAMGNGATTGTQVLNNVFRNNTAGVALANSGVAQVVVRQNLFDTNNQPGGVNAGIYSDQFVAGGVLSNVLIEDNAFTGNDDGISLSASVSALAATNVTIRENTFAANGRALFLFNVTNSTVAGNLIAGSTSAATADIRVFGGVVGLSITGNLMAGGAGDAIRIDNGGAVTINSAISVTNNSIAGYTGEGLEVVAAGYAGTLDASGNWWGSATGPTVASNVGGSGEAIVDAGLIVDYSPWLSTGTDLSAGVGFQGDFSLLTVNALSPRNDAQVAANVGNIQDAINLAPAAPTTVLVKDGTYVGDVNLNKAVRLIGDATINGGVTASVPSAILDPGVGSDAGVFTINGNLTLLGGARLITQINGTTVGTNLDRINVNGTVNLNGAVLDAALSFTAAFGSEFVLISNDGTDPSAASGTFAGLAQGAALTLNGQTFRVSYTGGDGNDVSLTRVLTNIRVRIRNRGVRQVFDVINGDTGALIRTITPFGPNFRGRIRVATGDLTGDLVPDVVVVKASGFGPIVQVYDGETGVRVTAFRPFPARAFGQYSVRVANHNSDTRFDIFVTLRFGNVIRTRVFSGVDFRLLAAFRETIGGGVNV